VVYVTVDPDAARRRNSQRFDTSFVVMWAPAEIDTAQKSYGISPRRSHADGNYTIGHFFYLHDRPAPVA
jgi:hypothetical protein